MNRSKMVIKNTLWEVSYYFAVILLGFLAPRYIISVYGSEINGLSSTITQILNVLLLLQSGATTAVIFSLYKPIAENDLQNICRNLSSGEYYFKKIAIIFAGLMIIAATITAFFINSNIKEIYIFVAFLIMGMKSFLDLFFTSKFRIVFTAYQEKFFVSVATLIEQIIYYILVFLTLYVKAHFIFMYLWLVLGCVIKIIYLEIFFKKRHSNIDTKPYRSVNIPIEGRNYALANEVSHSIVASSPMILLSFMYGLQVASIYSVYALVNSALNLFITALYSAFIPSFGNLITQEDKNNTQRVFYIFQYMFNMFNTLLMMCMLFLMIPFVKIYTAGAADIDYVKPMLAVVLSLNGLLFAYRIPYNIIVSTYGFFKETWKQPVVTSFGALLISVGLGVLDYPIIIVGPIFFYAVNFIYQHFKLKKLVPHLISKKTNVMFLISLTGFLLSFIASRIFNLPANMIMWIVQAFACFCISLAFILITSYLFLKNELFISYNYIKQILLRR